MKIMKLLDIFLNRKNEIVSKNLLMKEMNLSESYVRKLVREANHDSVEFGYKIRLIRKEGYFLEITDPKKFDGFLREFKKPEADLYNDHERTQLILFHILQYQNYFTYDKIAKKLNLSKATIIRALKSIEEILKQFGLFLERKPRYGLRLVGSEENYRKAFSKYVLRSSLFLEPTQEYYTYIKSYDKQGLRQTLKRSLMRHNCKMSDVAFDNMVEHIGILIYRAESNNFISRTKDIKETDVVYQMIAQDIAKWIKQTSNLELPKEEIQLLSRHLAGKTSVSNLSATDSKEMLDWIKKILTKIDTEFLTETLRDKDLHDSLLLHIYPLVNRMYNNSQLNNPLIDDIYKKYANVFLIAIRFGELMEEYHEFQLSRDEIGYISLHFAAHIERMRQKELSRIRRIVVVCATGGGSSQLLKLKLERLFPKAIVATAANYELETFTNEAPDLILTTIPIEQKFGETPIIKITEWLNEIDVKRIEEATVFYSSKTLSTLKDIVFEKFYYTHVTMDYISILKKMTQDLIDNEFAPKHFDKDVLKREDKFSTIYGKGIAGPHSIQMNALKNSISIAILDKPIEYKSREVRIIFLINLQHGYLFLHKEISKLLLFLMENDDERNKLINAKSFQHFKLELDRIIIT